MAKNSYIVAKRYARALWLLTDNPKDGEAMLAPVKTLSAAFKVSAELRNLVKSTLFSDDEKWGVIKELLDQAKAPEKLENFVKYLVQSKRLEVIPEIESAYTSLVYKSVGAVEAVVETAVALTEPQITQLTAQIEKLVGMRAILTEKVSPEILAGVKIHVEGKTYDLSLAANMTRIEKNLLKTSAIAEA